MVCFKYKLKESSIKKKELWKASKYLGLPNKISLSKVSTLRASKIVHHDTQF